MNTQAAPTETTAPDRAETTEREDRLRDAVVFLLRSSGYLVLRTVAAEVADGVVVLRGVVPSFHLKQVAQALALRVQGVREVRNLVEVCSRAAERIDIPQTAAESLPACDCSAAAR